MASEKHQILYSVLLELQAVQDALLPCTTGHLVHAMFLNLVKQFDPLLSAYLHNMQGPRPFTLSSLLRGTCQDPHLRIKRDGVYTVRVTLFDGGLIWQGLSTHLLETRTVNVQIGEGSFHLVRLLSSPAKDSTGWVQTTDWQTVTALPASSEIHCWFTSPTAFSLGQRMFSLVPTPTLLWESALRAWNVYAPEEYHCDRFSLGEALNQICIATCDLCVEEYQYTHAPQKGFVGTCCYRLPAHHQLASFFTSLVSFAQYAGIGYKTTMGMGQMKLLSGSDAKKTRETERKNSGQ